MPACKFLNTSEIKYAINHSYESTTVFLRDSQLLIKFLAILIVNISEEFQQYNHTKEMTSQRKTKQYKVFQATYR